jgi:hypothetical protein
MRTRITLVAGTAVAALCLAGPVFADKTFIEDPAGDSQGSSIDIVLAKGGHGVGDVLKHRATFAKKVNPNEKEGIGLLIETRRGGFTVSQATNGAVVSNAAGAVVGRAEIVPVGENGFKYKFRAKAIGDPKRYGWAFAALDADGEVVDRAPDAGFIRHRP